MKKTLKKIIDYATVIADPEKIILFGSIIQGNANVFSDVDLLIIAENTLARRDIVDRIVSYAGELSLKIDVLIYSEAEVEQETRTASSFVAAIIGSGKTVFERKKSLFFE
jgi:uncharacterized protein